MEYLKPEQYYSDRYDLHTIETCMMYYSNLKIGMYQKRDELNDHDDETFEKEVHKMVSYFINTINIDRFRHKKEKLNEWMENDRLMQEKYDQAEPLDNLLCHLCNSPTKVMMKDMFHAYDDDARVLFMYECVNCAKRSLTISLPAELRRGVQTHDRGCTRTFAQRSDRSYRGDLTIGQSRANS